MTEGHIKLSSTSSVACNGHNNKHQHIHVNTDDNDAYVDDNTIMKHTSGKIAEQRSSCLGVWTYSF